MSRYARFFDPGLRTELDRETFLADGLELSVARRPVADSALTVLVLHGGGGNADLVSPIASALGEAGFEAVAPDLPGYGRTAVPRDRIRYETWVAAVRELAEAEAARSGVPVAVFGLSMGGMLGYHAAGKSRSIGAVAATNLLDPGDPQVMRAVARTPRLAAMTRLLAPPLDPVAIPIRWLCRMDRIANDPELVRACIDDPRGAGSRVPLGFLRSWIGYRAEREPEEFDRPVLLVHPGDDRWTPTEVSLRFFDRLGSEKRFVELERCGHAPIEEPGATVMRKEVAAFLGRLATARPSRR